MTDLEVQAIKKLLNDNRDAQLAVLMIMDRSGNVKISFTQYFNMQMVFLSTSFSWWVQEKLNKKPEGT